MSKLVHLGEILITLQYKKFVTASELSEVLGVDKKTVYRYIDSLVEANIPVKTRKGRNGGYYLDSDFFMKEPSLTIDELEALVLAQEILTKKNGFAYEHQLKRAVTKVLNVARKDEKKALCISSNDKLFSYAKGGLNNFDDVFSKICFAVESGRAVEYSYHTEGKERIKQATVDPYNIIFKEGKWYLIGLEHKQNRVEAYDITRVENIEMTKYVFIKPSNFSLDEYLKNSWGVFDGESKRVVIKFNCKVSDTVARGKWHPCQELEKLEDGSIVLKFFIDTLDEVKGWILGFGAAAQVIEPEELKIEIINEINNCKKIYDI